MSVRLSINRNWTDDEVICECFSLPLYCWQTIHNFCPPRAFTQPLSCSLYALADNKIRGLRSTQWMAKSSTRDISKKTTPTFLFTSSLLFRSTDLRGLYRWVPLRWQILPVLPESQLPNLDDHNVAFRNLLLFSLPPPLRELSAVRRQRIRNRGCTHGRGLRLSTNCRWPVRDNVFLWLFGKWSSSSSTVSVCGEGINPRMAFDWIGLANAVVVIVQYLTFSTRSQSAVQLCCAVCSCCFIQQIESVAREIESSS